MTPQTRTLLTRLAGTTAALTDRITGHTDESERITDAVELQVLSHALNEMSRIAAWLAEYADWRGGAGGGDHGPVKAAKKAAAKRRKVRRALGYTIP